MTNPCRHAASRGVTKHQNSKKKKDCQKRFQNPRICALFFGLILPFFFFPCFLLTYLLPLSLPSYPSIIQTLPSFLDFSFTSFLPLILFHFSFLLLVSFLASDPSLISFPLEIITPLLHYCIVFFLAFYLHN